MTKADRPFNRTYPHAPKTTKLEGAKGTLSAREAGDRRACPDGFVTHIIRAGESLITIADRYNITLTELLEYNPNINPYFYTTGQILCLPSAPVVICPGAAEYQVAQGDTAASIAAKFGITTQELMAMNPDVNFGALVIAQILCVPVMTEPAPPPEPELPPCPYGEAARYIVTETDTLAGILTRFQVSYNAVVVANPDVDFDELAVGTHLCMPPAGTRGSCRAGFLAAQVEQNDSLESVAERHMTSREFMLMENPTLTPQDFSGSARQVICVPQNRT